MAPILLNNSRDSDDTNIFISKTVLPKYTPGPYTPKFLPEHLKPPADLLYVPPLAYFCINSLVQYVDLIDLGGMARVPCHPESHEASLKGLISFFTWELRETDMTFVDPRIWAALIQIYSFLPPCFTTYTLPLSDTHLTTLQGIRSTPDFTLLTVLDLSSRSALNDDTIGELKPLSNLCVLDLSGTRVGSWGVKKLSMCLTGTGEGMRGPWRVRIWSLRGCKNVDDAVKDALVKFPLLSVVDLRGTSTSSCFTLSGFDSQPPTSHDSLYHPNPPLSWIPALSSLFPHCQLFESSTPPHVLHINRLGHPLGRHIQSEVGDQDRVLALFPNGRKALHSGHALREATQNMRTSDGPRWNARQYQDDTWPRYYDEDEGSGDEDEDDEDDISDYFERLNDDNMSPLDHGEAWDYDSDNDMESLSERYRSDDEANEMAACEVAKYAAEQSARDFYTLRLRGGALIGESIPLKNTSRHPRLSRRLILQLLDGMTSITEQQKIGEAPTAESRPTRPAKEDGERNLMFFRMPPPFDKFPETYGSAGVTRRRKLDGEVISAKRRKLTSDTSGAPDAIFNRRGPAGSQAPHNQGQKTASPAMPFRKAPTVPANRSQGSVPVSNNPFLAKKKKQPQSQTVTTSLATSPSTLSLAGVERSSEAQPGRREKQLSTRSGPAGGSRSATLPSMFAAAANKPRTTSKPLEEPKGGTRGKSNKAFDMKAWAAKKK